MILASILKLSVLLFIIMDPFGNIPLFVSVLQPFSLQRQRAIILREMLIALFVMLVFFFFGNGFLDLLKVSDFTLHVTGGTVLFLIAIDMIFSLPKNDTELRKEDTKDPLIVPLAIPSIAGPAILATLAVHGAGVEYTTFVVLVSLILTWMFSTVILLFSPLIKKYLGNVSLSAVEQLFGFFVGLIALDMIIAGLTKAFSIN